MRHSFYAVLIFFILNTPSILAQSVEGLDYPSESVATADRSTSGIFNPAGLAFWNAMGLYYAHSFTDSSYKGDDGAILSSHSTFFSVEWLNHGNNIFRRKYTIASGDRLFQDFYLGLSYSWFGGSNAYFDRKKDWKFGLLYHPRPFASLGFVVDRINEPKLGGIRQRRLYQPGLALRPFGDLFTISADGRLVEKQALSKLQGDFRLAAGPFHGVSVITQYRTEGQWRLTLAFDIQQTRIGGQGRLANKNKFDGGAYFIELGTMRYGSALASTRKTGVMDLKDDIVEEPGQKQLFGQPRRSFFSVISDLRNGAADPRIKDLLIKIDGIHLDFASAQELRSAIFEYRAHGKKVTAYMDEAGNLEYYLASSADEICMDPTGLLELKGLSATTRFYKGTMDKLGVKAEIIRTGPHKTYGDPFVDTTLTESAREQINWLLDDLYSQFVDGISTGRRLLPEKVKTLIDNGPYTAQDAYKAGLIDGLKHYDEIIGDDKKLSSQTVDLSNFNSVSDYNPRWSEPKKIAIVYADGSIMRGKSGSSFLDGKVIGSETLAGALKKIRNDNSIKGVVFRVNSPGGDVFASEEIYRELELIKGQKPVVVSMGGVAASGGYYIACPGDEILASPGTITGSIGVVMGKADLSGFYQKIGVNNETLTRGTHADIRSSTRPATDDERALIEKMLWEYYSDFVNKVTTWRPLDYDSVDAIGQGRVWTGRQARERGLVDNCGGIWEALEQTRQKAKIDPDDDLDLEIFPVYGFSLMPAIGMPMLETQLSSLLEAPEREGYFYKSPIEIKIK
jgi:protease IV